MHPNRLSDLRHAAARQQFLHLDTAAEMTYICSDEYLQDVEACEADPRRRAILTCHLLEHVALDPLQGSDVTHFVQGANRESGALWAWCQLHGISNFVGYFTLPREVPEAIRLLGAARKNLEGDQFAGARAYRSFLQHSSPRRYQVMDQLASEAKRTEYARLVAETGSDTRLFARDQWERIRDGSNAAYNRVFVPMEEKLHEEQRGLSDLTMSPEFGAVLSAHGYFGAVAWFAAKYLPLTRVLD